jgi:molybdopterin-guanine dinucleotide biosynthesis protein B
MEKKVFGLTGSSGSGKTTLAEHLISWFRIEGYTISTLKHAHHGFDVDKPDKDSYRMREAGAQEVFLIGDRRWVLMHEYRDEEEPSLDSLVERLAPCDIVLVEGFRKSSVLKIEVYRPSLENPPSWPGNPSIVAVATDSPIDCPLPVLDLNCPAQIAQYIHDHLFSDLLCQTTRQA